VSGLWNNLDLLGCLTMMQGGGVTAAAAAVACIFENGSHGKYTTPHP